MSTPPRDPERDRLHRQAEKILAARGKRPGEYSAEEYAAAGEEAAQGGFRLLEQALESLGEPLQTEVTESLLYERMTEILVERGFNTYDGKGGVNPASEEDRLDALIEAIRELGKPGETRKDLAEVAAAARERLIARAIDQGSILASHADSHRQLWDKDPALAAKFLAEAKPAFVYKAADGTPYPVDADSMELHRAAEAILASDQHVRRDRAGNLVYSAEQYEEALIQASEVRSEAEKTARGA